MMVRIKHLLNKILSKFGSQIVSIDIIPLWEQDAGFNKQMRDIIKHTIVGKTRCYMIYQLTKQVNSLPGDVVEVGVYKGGTARLLARMFEAQNKVLHLFDTFTGMPPSDSEIDSHHKQGDFSDVSLASVRAYLHDCKNVAFYQGVFPYTSKPLEDKTFCLVHIDVDIYKSGMDCCKFFYSRMVKNGIMIFDDYGFKTCPGIKKAVDEFFAYKPESPCYLLTGQCIVIKL